MKKQQELSQKMLDSFPDNFKLDLQTRAIHLIEEAVELATVISKYENRFPVALQEGEIDNGFGGVLFDLFALASKLGVDLEKIYPKELKKFSRYSSKN